MFEVQDLRFATLATVSRCGMVWFSEDVLTNQMIFDNFLIKLRGRPMEETEEDVRSRSQQDETGQELVSPTLSVRVFVCLELRLSDVDRLTCRTAFGFELT